MDYGIFPVPVYPDLSILDPSFLPCGNAQPYFSAPLRGETSFHGLPNLPSAGESVALSHDSLLAEKILSSDFAARMKREVELMEKEGRFTMGYMAPLKFDPSLMPACHDPLAVENASGIKIGSARLNVYNMTHSGSLMSSTLTGIDKDIAPTPAHEPESAMIKRVTHEEESKVTDRLLKPAVDIAEDYIGLKPSGFISGLEFNMEPVPDILVVGDSDLSEVLYAMCRVWKKDIGLVNSAAVKASEPPPFGIPMTKEDVEKQYLDPFKKIIFYGVKPWAVPSSWNVVVYQKNLQGVNIGSQWQVIERVPGEVTYIDATGRIVTEPYWTLSHPYYENYLNSGPHLELAMSSYLRFERRIEENLETEGVALDPGIKVFANPHIGPLRSSLFPLLGSGRCRALAYQIHHELVPVVAVQNGSVMMYQGGWKRMTKWPDLESHFVVYGQIAADGITLVCTVYSRQIKDYRFDTLSKLALMIPVKYELVNDIPGAFEDSKLTGVMVYPTFGLGVDNAGTLPVAYISPLNKKGVYTRKEYVKFTNALKKLGVTLPSTPWIKTPLVEFDYATGKASPSAAEFVTRHPIAYDPECIFPRFDHSNHFWLWRELLYLLHAGKECSTFRWMFDVHRDKYALKLVNLYRFAMISVAASLLNDLSGGCGIPARKIGPFVYDEIQAIAYRSAFPLDLPTLRLPRTTKDESRRDRPHKHIYPAGPRPAFLYRPADATAVLGFLGAISSSKSLWA